MAILDPPCAIRVAGHGPNGSSPSPHICDKSFGSLCPSYMHEYGPSSQKSSPEDQKSWKWPYYGHFWAIRRRPMAKKVPSVNMYWHQGWAGIPVSRDSREYKPQISRPFPSRGILNFPFPFPGKGSFGRELGREILSLFAVLNIF